MKETVAVCTLIEDRKAALLDRLVPRWNALDLGGRRAQYVVGRTDASEATCARFAALAGYDTTFVTCADLAEQVPGLGVLGEGRFGSYANEVFLHKIAVLRESVRRVALQTAAEWFFWLDADIDPEGGAPSFGCLHQVLTATVGPLAPQVVSGLYATRFGGLPISQWIEAGDESRYIPLQPDCVQASRVAGFGCVLMRRELLEAVSWAPYGEYRRRRREVIAEQGSEENIGILGEDVFWFRSAEAGTGVPIYTDNRVRCRHYQEDGRHWQYEPDEAGERLVVRYHDTPLPGAASVRVRNRLPVTMTLAPLALAIPAGEGATVAPETAEMLDVLYPGGLERIGEEVADAVAA